MSTESTVSSRNLTRPAQVLALMVLVFAGLFGLQAWRSEKAEQATQMRTALALGHNAIDQYFSQVQSSLSWLASDLVQPDGVVIDLKRVNAELQRFKAEHAEISAINLMGMDGQILASSNADAGAALPNVARETSFVRFLAELTPTTRLSLGQPLLGSLSQKWITPLRYVIRNPQGQPTLILAASVPVELLESFWRQAPITAKAAMGLIRDDGFLISRFPLPKDMPLEKVYGEPRRGALYEHLRQQGFPRSGYVEGPNQIGGYEAGNVFQRLEFFPVTMFVSQPRAAFQAAWWQRVQVPFALLGLLSVGGWLGYRYSLGRQTEWDVERRQAETALRKSANEQRFLIDHILAGVVRHGPDGAVLTVNAQARRLLGLSQEQMLGRVAIDPVWHFIREDGSRMPVSEYPVQQVLQTQKPVADQVLGIVHKADAPPVWVIVNTYPDFNPDASLRSVIVTFLDITARKLTEQALQQSENRYRMLFQNSMDAVLQSKPNGAILSANDAACKMFRMSEAELLSVDRRQLIDPDDPRTANLLETRARRGRAAGELLMRRGDGSSFEAEISSAIYTDGFGAELASLVIRDVTESRRAEAATRARQLAEQANRAKSDFIARMSHELRTPLNAILGFSEVLQLDDRHTLAPIQRERLTQVQRAGDHLLLLINDLLDLSRIEAGGLSLVLKETDALEIVTQAVMAVEPQAAAQGVQLRIDTPTQPLPPVRMDPTRLRQVMLNLLSNAIKYNRPGGTVDIGLSATSTQLRLSVRDTGLGMSPEQLSALFQPFNRLGRESSSTEGTGIGLVITRSLVEAMGGHLSVHSESGQGSTFTVLLALSQGRPRVADSSGAAAPTPTAADAESARPSQVGVQGQVIYIDDDEVNQMLMQAFLAQRPGIALHTIGDGPGGIALALAAPPDLMLIDLMMPGMDGLQVMKAVRAQPSLAAVRCVAVSANAMPDEIEAALAAGFDSYLTKPISSQLLLGEIDRWVGAAGQARPA